MNRPIQLESRARRTKAPHNGPSAETFTPESAKDYVLDLHARGKLGTAGKGQSKVSTPPPGDYG